MSNDKLERVDWLVVVALKGKKLPTLRRILAAILILFALSGVLVPAAGLAVLRLALLLGFTPEQMGTLLGALVKKVFEVP